LSGNGDFRRAQPLWRYVPVTCEAVLLDVFDRQFNWLALFLAVMVDPPRHSIAWAAGAFSRSTITYVVLGGGAFDDGVGLFYSALDSVVAA
jgi:hypothetical protein